MRLDPPIDLLQYFTPADLARGAEWSREGSWVNLVSLALNILILLAASFSAPGRALWRWSERVGQRGQPGPIDRVLGADWRTGAVFLGALALVRAAATFPLDFWHDFHRAHAIGLSKESLGHFLGQTLLGVTVSVVANALLGASLSAIRRRWPRRWWLALGGAAAIALVGDAVLEPLWQHVEYQVTPLEAGPIRTRIEAMLDAQQADVGAIVVVNASKHGTSANAFVTGFGPTKRLVLTDTLLHYGEEAVVGAVAHEIGHRRGERMPPRLAIAALALIGFLYLIERCLRLASRWGAAHSAQGFPFFRAVSIVLLFAVQPVQYAASRAEEREADELELTTRHDYDAYIAEQVRLVRSNASDPWPGAWVRLFMSHPTAAERIERALWYKARVAGGNP